MRTKALVFIPTYNERENVEEICREINGLGLNLDVLFVDDNSPDGTGEVVDRLAQQYPNVNVVHRAKKLGIGSAHLAGIRWAYDRGYAVLITMDCDFTHLPRYLPDFIENAKDQEVIVGSRYFCKGSLKEWNLFRKTLTLFAHFLTKIFLKMPYDATGAYRLYRLDKIDPKLFDLIQSSGYAFFFESLYALHINQFKIKEMPILVPARTYGHSKMSIKEVLHSVYRLHVIYFTASNARGRYEKYGLHRNL